MFISKGSTAISKSIQYTLIPMHNTRPLQGIRIYYFLVESFTKFNLKLKSLSIVTIMYFIYMRAYIYKILYIIDIYMYVYYKYQYLSVYF
jgi:hypothetical protein